MAWKQSRQTKRLLAQGEISDGKHCVICGHRIARNGGFPVCGTPSCRRRYADRYGSEVE
jgi:hypothetical protein